MPSIFILKSETECCFIIGNINLVQHMQINGEHFIYGKNENIVMYATNLRIYLQELRVISKRNFKLTNFHT